VQALVVGSTTRYKSKYVTTILYKPKGRRRVLDGSGATIAEA
jgi:5'-AMP-activated protein kinase regulatory beta subunit